MRGSYSRRAAGSAGRYLRASPVHAVEIVSGAAAHPGRHRDGCGRLCSPWRPGALCARPATGHEVIAPSSGRNRAAGAPRDPPDCRVKLVRGRGKVDHPLALPTSPVFEGDDLVAGAASRRQVRWPIASAKTQRRCGEQRRLPVPARGSELNHGQRKCRTGQSVRGVSRRSGLVVIVLCALSGASWGGVIPGVGVAAEVVRPSR